jgi:hypothetical protein
MGFRVCWKMTICESVVVVVVRSIDRLAPPPDILTDHLYVEGHARAHILFYLDLWSAEQDNKPKQKVDHSWNNTPPLLTCGKDPTKSHPYRTISKNSGDCKQVAQAFGLPRLLGQVL